MNRRIEDIKIGLKFRYANDAYEIINIDNDKEIIYIKDLFENIVSYRLIPVCFTFTAFIELCDANLISPLINMWLDLEKRLQDIDAK